MGIDTTAPRIVSVQRTGREGERTSASTLGFEVTFSEPVHVDPGDLEIARSPGSWRRVEKNIGPHYDEQDRRRAARDPYYKPCNPDEDRIYANLGTSAGWDLIERLDDECYRRKQLSRHWHVLASGGALVGTIYYEVDLVVAANHDMVDVHGNRLDSTLPTGDAYEGYIIDRRGPSPRMTASATEHDGSTPFTVTVDFRAPVWGFRAGDMRFNADLASVTLSSGSDGASVYVLTVTPLNDTERLISLSLPRGVATDAAGNVNDRGGTVLLTRPPVARPGATFSTLALSVPEGGTASYTIVLDTQPSANVGITLSATGDPDIGLSGGTVNFIFTPTNWSTPQTITVSAREDTDSANGTKTFTHTMVTTDTDYAALTLPSLTATEADNDFFYWSAEMDVEVSSSHTGYCQGSCTRYSSSDNNSYGSLSDGTDNAFPAPAVSGGSVAVTAVAWAHGSYSDVVDEGDLILRMNPFPAASVYNAWTLTVDGTSVAFSDNDGVVLSDTLRFNDFFGSATRPSGDDVDVCITDDPNGCPDSDDRGTADTTLSALTLTDAGGSAVTLSPGFASGTTEYAAEVTAIVSTVTVAATATAAGAAVAIAPADADGTTSGHQVDLSEGANRITVTVTNGSATRSYTVTVTREPAPAPLWSAMMTVASTSSGNGFFHADEYSGTVGSLTDRDFNYAPGSETKVNGLYINKSDTEVQLQLGPFPNSSNLDGCVLHWNGGSGIFDDVTRRTNTVAKVRFDWSASTFFSGGATAPGDGDTVSVSITADPDGSGCSVTSGGGSGTSGTESPGPALEARFGVHPAWHTGMPFWTELHFSAEPDVGYKDLRDKAFEVTGARITRAQRIEQGSSRSWRLLVEPAGFGDISLTLPATEDCTAEGAVCTAEGERLETGLALAVPGPGDRLAARLKGTSSHEGEAFRLKLHFSHEPNLSYRDVRDKLFEVTGGRITRAKRLAKGSNLGWRLTVEPDGVGAVALELPATESCGAEGAVCTRDGRRLERGIAWTVEGPPAFSVSDAEVEEAPGAALAFEVSLSRRLRAEARVDVATVDGTATAGADYEAVTQTLVFAPGETVKTVEVAVLDDAHDEGEETMTLVLSNATGAPVADAEGTGTIVNNDAIPKAWIARFGRTVTGQVLDAVEARLAAPRQAGGRMTVAGYALAAPGGSGGSAGTGGGTQTSTQATLEDRAAVAALGGWMDGARTGRSQALRERRDGGPEPKSLDITRHALVTGTSFTLTGGSADGGGFASLWGHASVAGFDGREDALTLDGEVTTGFLGADWAAERWTAGLALGHSAGTGGYRNGECVENTPADGTQSGGCGGRIEAELTGLYPYAGLDVTERVSVWLAGGHGAGELTVIPDGPNGSGAIGTDLAMRMGAGGTRIAVLGSEGGEGFNLALKGDGRFTRTSSDAARSPDGGNLAEAEADVWLLRLGVEGSRPFALGTGETEASLTPSFELALRRDGGDAETGLGADMGGGLALAAPERGLRFDLKGRALVAHEAPGFREWGASAGFGFDPRPSTERGLSVSLTQAFGASPSGGMDALLDRKTLAGFATSDDGSGRFEASSRLTGELGYGLPAFGGDFTGTPNIGFGLSETGHDWRLGWRLTPARPGASGFEVTLDATRRESADADAEHGVALGGRFRW